MNATQSKTRARAKEPALRAAPPASQSVTIDDIRRWISMAEEKLELAYDAAERGEPIDTLLDHINHDVVLTPFRIIHRGDLTQSDARRVFSGLFPVLACLEGAIKLAAKTVISGTLSEAHQLLDAAQSALDPVEDAVRSLPEGGPAHDFERGKALAIDMLRAVAQHTSACEGLSRHREPGSEQENPVMDALVELDGNEFLDGGFTAVLTAALAAGSGASDTAFLDSVTLEETQQCDGRRNTCEPTTREVPHGINQIDEAGCMLVEAVAILSARLVDHNHLGEVAYGALRLTRACHVQFEAAATQDDYEDVSAALGSAIAVLDAANFACDDMVLHGVHRLLTLCKETLDAALSEAM